MRTNLHLQEKNILIAGEKNIPLSEAVGLALDSLKQFLLEDVVGGVEGDGHTLAARGGHGK